MLLCRSCQLAAGTIPVYLNRSDDADPRNETSHGQRAEPQVTYWCREVRFAEIATIMPTDRLPIEAEQLQLMMRAYPWWSSTAGLLQSKTRACSTVPGVFVCCHLEIGAVITAVNLVIDGG